MPMDLDQLASAMFPSMPTSKPNDAAPVINTSAELRMAETLFGETTKPPPPSTPNRHDKRPFDTLTEADKEARLFQTDDPTLYHGDSMRSIESAAMEKFLSSPEDARDAAEHWGNQFQLFELTSSESAAVADIGVSVFTNPASPELVATWTEQAREVLVQDFGPKGAAQALADAREFVTTYATPELKDVLMSTGLGNHPQLVRIAAAKARALRQAGKL